MADLDRVVLHWYLGCKEKNIQMKAGEIRRKALEINKILNVDPSFRASSKWLRDFKERNRITSADINEDLPAEHLEAEAFTVDFISLLQKNGFALKNVYNVVYIEMMWKAVPEGTSILCRAKSTGSLKICENHVTALFCVNATGCHKLPVLIIGNII